MESAFWYVSAWPGEDNRNRSALVNRPHKLYATIGAVEVIVTDSCPLSSTVLVQDGPLIVSANQSASSVPGD